MVLTFFYFVNIKVPYVENIISFWFQIWSYHVSTEFITTLMLRILNGVWPFAKTVLQSHIPISFMKEKGSVTLLFTSHPAVPYILPNIYYLIYFIYIVQHQLLQLLEQSNEIVLEAILWKC